MLFRSFFWDLSVAVCMSLMTVLSGLRASGAMVPFVGVARSVFPSRGRWNDLGDLHPFKLFRVQPSGEEVGYFSDRNSSREELQFGPWYFPRRRCDTGRWFQDGGLNEVVQL